MNDWREQVSRIEKSYDAIFNTTGGVSPNDGAFGNREILNLQPDAAGKTYLGANRFPPRPRPTPLGPLDTDLYESILLSPPPPPPLPPAGLELGLGEAAATRGTYLPPVPPASAEAEVDGALMAELGGLLQSAVDSRDDACTRGQYLLSLPLTTPESDAAHLSEVSIGPPRPPECPLPPSHLQLALCIRLLSLPLT